MDAAADRMDYDMSSEVITFTGNYTVEIPEGLQQRPEDGLQHQDQQHAGGGDGSRVSTIIYPKSAQGQKPKPADKP